MIASRHVLGFAVATLLGLGSAVRADDARSETKRTISVSGQGEVQGVPDRALVSFAVEVTGTRATDAANENAKRSNAVRAALEPVLYPEDTMTTTRYSLEPRYEASRPGEVREPRIIGYVARNQVQVETRLIEKLGTLIDNAANAGANRVDNLQFFLSQRADLVRVALEQAAADARAQAESIAKGLGVRLKGVVSANASSGPIALPRHFEARAMAAEARLATPIEPGEVKVSANLQVTYEIE
jgi:uncharacterized protein YggE